MRMDKTVSLGQMFELEANIRSIISIRIDVLPKRPPDAPAPQRPNGADEREKIPARTSVFPLMRIWIQKIAPEKEAGDLIVEARRVVADADRAGLIEPRPDFSRGIAFRHALFFTALRRQPRHETAFRLRQIVVRGLGI